MENLQSYHNIIWREHFFSFNFILAPPCITFMIFMLIMCAAPRRQH